MIKILYLIEAAALQLLFIAFRALPLDMSSYIGGFIARSIGPFLKSDKIARENIAACFPERSGLERDNIRMQMWDNLGRSAAEFANLSRPALHDRVTRHGTEHIIVNGPAIYLSGHFANWELSYPTLFRHDIPIALIYRHANNPYTDNVILKVRSFQSSELVPKGARGAIKLRRVLKNKLSLAMLIDQKMNDGIPVPFFGRDAMTAPAIAQMAMRYNLPLIPIRVIRTHGCHFEWHAYPPLQYEKTGDEEKDVLALMTQINQVIESWVRERPDQWFWVHRRWPKAS